MRLADGLRYVDDMDATAINEETLDVRIEGERVRLTTGLRELADRLERFPVGQGFRVVPYDVPGRCAATYFPEANPLVPVKRVAARRQMPNYKSMVVTLSPNRGGAA